MISPQFFWISRVLFLGNGDHRRFTTRIRRNYSQTFLEIGVHTKGPVCEKGVFLPSQHLLSPLLWHPPSKNLLRTSVPTKTLTRCLLRTLPRSTFKGAHSTCKNHPRMFTTLASQVRLAKSPWPRRLRARSQPFRCRNRRVFASPAAKNRNRVTFGVNLKIAGNSQATTTAASRRSRARFCGCSDHGTLSIGCPTALTRGVPQSTSSAVEQSLNRGERHKDFNKEKLEHCAFGAHYANNSLWVFLCILRRNVV